MLEWVSISFFRGSSWPKDRTCISCIVGRFFTVVLLGKPFREEGSVLKDSWNTSTCWEKEKLSCVIKSLENWVSVVSVRKKHCFFTFNFPTSFFLKKIYFYFILLCNTVLVLPYIDMRFKFNDSKVLKNFLFFWIFLFLKIIFTSQGSTLCSSKFYCGNKKPK